MLDDVEFEHCEEGDVPEDSNQLSCDFDQENTCSWYHDYTASIVWKSDGRDSGSEFAQFQFHWITLLLTQNNSWTFFWLKIFLFCFFVCFQYLITTSADFYMYIEASEYSDVSSTARLMSFPRPVGQIICVSFWYRIFGNSIGMCLKVSTKTKQNTLLVQIVTFWNPEELLNQM